MRKIGVIEGLTSFVGNKDRITRKLKQTLRNFIVIVENSRENVIYLSNEDVTVRKGTRVKIIEGEFTGARRTLYENKRK